MRIITAVFDYPGINKYARCLRALSNSIYATNKDASFKKIRLHPPSPVDGAYQGWVNNHIKLEAYSREPLDENTMFVDADTVFLRNADHLFYDDFDIGIARRPGKQKSIYNGGVVLVKPTEAARTFMEHWIAVDTRMLYDQEFHSEWHKKYRGQNQSSMGYLIENNPCKLKIKEFPTSVINACEQDWQNVLQIKPYILHVRKWLLELALSDIPLEDLSYKHKDAVKIWRDFEK